MLVCLSKTRPTLLALHKQKQVCDEELSILAVELNLAVRKRAGGKSSSGKGSFELAASMPMAEVYWCCSLGRTRKEYLTCAYPSISPVLKFHRNTGLSNYGYLLCL